ncbi:MAG: ABC transporter ATP-binding protein [Chloroflexi bacterium]|nr:ABC transporter ATP-binding protein [Chloroflexota bacterium]
MKPVISLRNVSVRYRVPKERIPSLKEYAIRWLNGKRVEYMDFWALHDVNLEVHKGEVLGIIGQNGAGKSTLLKVVARVMKPTEGNVRVVGKLAPLLELGAGFDSELTGRENIYLNGAILGFSRREMDQKFERIVDFAELWDFIDAPLRTYSTGMVARLGFAIATDINPDILLIDEVLAVGDEGFQRKCAERIDRLMNDQIITVIVSHSMDLIRTMCDRAVWLEHGLIQALGEVNPTVSSYLSFLYE